MTSEDDLLPSAKKDGWLRRFAQSLGRGLTPETAANAVKRAARTFLQAAVAVVVAAGVDVINVDVAEGAAIAGLAAVAALIQNALSK